MDRPIIKHCRNCKWYANGYNYNCTVKYKRIYRERLTALLCKHYCNKNEQSHRGDAV